jgi:hypothetical protein
MASSADRRRKLLRDESGKSGVRAAPSTNSGARRRGKAYSSDAKADNQPRITDFIPLRPLHLWLWFLTACVAGALVNALYLVRVLWWGSPESECLLLSGPGTLARATSAFVLAMAGVVASMILHIRRFRLDDYQGRYRAWRIVAGACFLASLDAATDIHHVVIGGIAQASATLRNTDAAILWLGGWYALGILLWARIHREVWVSRTGSLLIFLGICSYVAGTMSFLGKWGLPDPVLRQMATFALVYLGHCLTLLSLVVYLRYVYLHSQNALPLRVPRKQSRKQPAAEMDAMEDSEEEPQETEPRRPQEARSGQDPRRQGSVDTEQEGDERGSKADRRKMRREHRHSRAA